MHRKIKKAGFRLLFLFIDICPSSVKTFGFATFPQGKAFKVQNSFRKRRSLLR